jgi:glycine C-acetyltransferase
LDTSRQTKNLNKLLIRILLHLQVEFSFVNAIFPPVVPPKMCRIRIGVMSCHTQEDCDRLLDVFYETGKKYGII